MSGENFFNNSKLKIKPSLQELELSVFGRGFGECIILSCGNNDFIVVDSFVNPETNQPIALDYIKAIGLQPSAIKQVIVTHWHQDHIEGLVNMLEEIGNGVTVILNPIISKDRFNEYISVSVALRNEKVREFTKLCKYIKENKIKVLYAMQDKRLFSNELFGSAELIALSPQDDELSKYLNSIILPEPGKPNSLPYMNENMFSIVLLAKYAHNGIILGSDLEISNIYNGWKAIVDNYTHSSCKPSVIKVAHHGSENGYYDPLWKNIMDKEPISVVTAFNKGYKLPKDADIDRIKTLSKEVYLAGNKTKKDRDLKNKVGKINPNIQLETISCALGLVRYRRNIKNLDASPLIETFAAVKRFTKD